MPKSVIITASSDIATDQRILRMSDLLQSEGYNVQVVGRELASSLPTDRVVANTHRFRMIFRKGFLFYKWLNIRLLFFLIKRKPDLLIAVDLDTLLPAVFVSRIKSIPLLFDAHEYFTGVPELRERHFVRWVWKKIERFCIRRLRYMVTVNDSIADLFTQEYGIVPVVVRNISRKALPGVSSREEMGISSDDMVMVIQGTGINTERGGIEAIKVVERINRSVEAPKGTVNINLVHLLVIGHGDELPLMKQYVMDQNLFEHVTFLAAMEWEDMIKHTRMADIGLSLDKSDSLNYKYSLPNKIFDYLNAGVAILATDLPEIKKIVDKYDCGIIIKDNSVESISSAVEKVRVNRELLNKLKKNSITASDKFSWEEEKLILLSVIKRVLLNK